MVPHADRTDSRPGLIGDYVHIYEPQGDTYRSKAHPLFKPGMYCDTWVSNDFSIIHDGNTWHMIGITGPRLPKEIYRDEFDHNPGCGHGPEAIKRASKGSLNKSVIRFVAAERMTKGGAAILLMRPFDNIL